ncbi:MAG: hypothetical protein L6R38_001607 [Xanthoria sp. 2 TBL-2021]|nr:MAG: hypothetical protein L6R38_001607 [Xanthoria sp. 2 TBL-2021]
MEMGKVDSTDAKHANVDTRPVDSPNFHAAYYGLTNGGTGDHWVSAFAPKSVEKPLSYNVGWLTLLGWVTGCPSVAQLTLTLVQGLILLKDENANVAQPWQTTLFIMIFLIVAVAFNLFLAGKLPLAEGIFLIVHIFGYFAFLIVLWTMSDHAPASQVFGTFSGGGRWGSTGLSCLVGITTPLRCSSDRMPAPTCPKS